MLTAAQIEAIRAQSEKLVDPITEFLIEDIAKRIAQAGQFTATASYEAWKLQQMGISQRKLKKEIAKRLGVSLEEAEKLLTQAAKTGYNFDMSRFPTSQAIPLSANSSLQQILNATVKLAREDLTNITQTMGFVGPDGQCRDLTDAYNAACDYAFQKVSTGAQDYQSAIRDATRNLAEKGIRTIDYKSGYHTSIEAAVRQNIMGGMGLMVEQISESNHDLLGCDGWEISAHAGSAPDHEPIQGKQYSDKAYKELNNSLVRCIGTLNCGHAAFPIIMGVNSPQYTEEELEEFRQQNEEGVTFEGKHYTLYEATQRQRKFERSIRKQKRRILVDEATEDKDKLQTDQIRLIRLRQEYARFSKGVGLPMQHARMETAGFDWKKGKAAESVAKAAEKAAEAGHTKEHSSFDITEKGKYKVLTYDNTADYSKYISPEYNAQKMTHAEDAVLFAKDGGYIQNADGYKDINGFMRGIKDRLDNPRCQKTMDVLIKRTSKPALKHNYVGFRKVNPSYLQDVLGLETAGKLKSVGMPWEGFVDIQSAQELSDQINKFVGTERAYVTDKAVTSVSLCEKLNFFKHRPVKLEIQMRKGTKGLITRNYPESEFIAKPNTTLEILGSMVYDDKGKPSIKIFARMLQN